jgi:transcriptional regulator with PAS, ATPase and Fis domain
MAIDPPQTFMSGAPPADAEFFHGMWTRSPALKSVFRVIERVANEDVTVLIRGETGTGKELVAQAMHTLSHRHHGPFRAINCAALPPALLESELFGHVRGAFTGAHRDTPGHFQLAHRGTLFLDEIAELPLELQAKLLRVLETHTVLPVGGREPIPVDVRIVSATHRALRREAEAGRFRADLMYRLRVIPVFLPPLRERDNDIALLVDRFVQELNERGVGRGRRQIREVHDDALACLSRHDWPGNIRELRNVLTYSYIMGDGPILRPFDLPPEITCAKPDGDLWSEDPNESPIHAPGTHTRAEQAEAQRIKIALGDHGGHLGRAAAHLGISRTTLWRRMKQLGLG